MSLARFRIFICLVLFVVSQVTLAKNKITIGSKSFLESYVLAEMLSLILEENGFEVERKFGLNGTAVAWQALTNKKIDLYPEYTGTLSHLILKEPELSRYEDINKALEKVNLRALPPFGFENNYGVATTSQFAKKNRLSKISQLKDIDFRAAVNFESINREDGWNALLKFYGIQMKSSPLVIEHTLAFQALESDEADVMVIYTTDGKIKKFNLTVLEDDKKFTPAYEALVVAQKDTDKRALRLLSVLSNGISQSEMLEMNEQVDVQGKLYSQVARSFLEKKNIIKPQSNDFSSGISAVWKRVYPLALEHVYLVLVSTIAAALVAIPLGVMLFRFQRFAKPVLYLVGLLQTIPSLALLVYMIPILGVSVESALLALFLYSLLPILQNTYSGLNNVSPNLVKAAKGIGLTKWETLTSVELPISAPIILAGVRVATVINVGTATIAAFIGSGGLGELIVQGLTLNDLNMMQQGAIPAAFLAIVFNLFFTSLEKRFDYT